MLSGCGCASLTLLQRFWPFTLSSRELVLITVFLLSPSEARAEWLVMPFFGLKFAGSMAFLDLEQAESETKNVFGGSAAWLGSGILGIEADFAFVPGYFERRNAEPVWANSHIAMFSGSVLVAMPLVVTRDSLRPYLVVGAGVLRASADDIRHTFSIADSMPSMTIGGGALGMLSARTGVRFDLRYQRTIGQSTEPLEPGGHKLSLWRATAAYVRRF
jgi:hypothetical protein